ncbi:energy transducer TonB [Fluviicola sp.]|uniref:energy transducer TonB n=1 Tax=Fluviicola sp. TaxID=1917219 RepID=UPI0031D25AF9
MVLTLSIMAIIVAFSLYDYFSSRSWQMVTSRERNETVFENRNKAYGAYQIRRDYDKRILLIFLGFIVGIGGLWAASGLFRPIERTKPHVVIIDPFAGTMDEQKDQLPEIPKPEVEKPAAQSLADITAFRVPTPTDDRIDDPKINIVDQNTNVGLVDQKGDPNVDPFDPNKILTNKGTGDGPGIETKIDDKPVEIVDEPAKFPGGMDALRQYIADNIDINSIEGSAKVYLKFVVDTDGSISLVTVTKSSDDCKTCEKAAIKVVKSMPHWTPGKVNGQPVKSYYRMPINIQ